MSMAFRYAKTKKEIKSYGKKYGATSAKIEKMLGGGYSVTFYKGRKKISI
jgi:hypothetical protein